MDGHVVSERAGGALPTFVVIGAMKCGTTALHRMLGAHPQIAVSHPKELNFFFGDPDRTHTGWCTGNAHRGLEWYRSHFPPDAVAAGESSPGYTSPDHADVAARMAAVLPHAQLIYCVRDPIQRALSQYRHHRRDGDETRPIAEALLDPGSQYVSRSRYAERLAPFLACYPHQQLAIIAQEELYAEPARTLGRLFAWLGVDPSAALNWPRDQRVRRHAPLDARTEAQLVALLREDTERLRTLAGRHFAGWRV